MYVASTPVTVITTHCFSIFITTELYVHVAVHVGKLHILYITIILYVCSVSE